MKLEHLLAVLAVLVIVAVALATQPERTDQPDGMPVRVVDGVSTPTQRVPAVIRCDYTAWREPYFLHPATDGSTSYIVAGFGDWQNGDDLVHAAHLYVTGQQYPVMRLWIGDRDPDSPTDPGTLADRTRFWSNGLHRAHGEAARGGRVELVPVDDDGNVIDPADWGWVGGR